MVRGAELSPQIVCGDSTRGRCFLSVVHLVMETVQLNCRALVSRHMEDFSAFVAGHTTRGMNCVVEGLVLLTAVTITDVSPSWNRRSQSSCKQEQAKKQKQNFLLLEGKG